MSDRSCRCLSRQQIKIERKQQKKVKYLVSTNLKKLWDRNAVFLIVYCWDAGNDPEKPTRKKPGGSKRARSNRDYPNNRITGYHFKHKGNCLTVDNKTCYHLIYTICIYPTPQQRPGVTQGQTLSGVLLEWIQSFPSPRFLPYQGQINQFILLFTHCSREEMNSCFFPRALS